MNKIMRKNIPATAIAFMIVVIYSCISNLIAGNTIDGFAIYILEVLAFLIVTQIIGVLIDKVDFKSYVSHFIVETIIIYPVILSFAYIGNWFSFNIGNVVFNSLVYIVVMILIHYYFYKVTKNDADGINKILEYRNKNIE